MYKEFVKLNPKDFLEVAGASNDLISDGDSPLRRWWCDAAFDEADRTITKMEEYGSMDLVHIGRMLWDVMGRTSPLSDVAAMEVGCLFYIYGKIQRAVSALKNDKPIKDDTWFDTQIYAKMAQAARAGVWPLEDLA